MRFFRWIIIGGAIVAGLAVLAIAVGVFWLNTFIHSPAFKAEVESRASQSVGGPVQIQSIDFDIFHGLKLQGLVTQIDPGHAGGQGALKIQVASVNCTYSLTNLLARQLRLTGVTLDQPQIVLTKQATAPMAPAQPAPVTAATPSGPLTSETPAQGTSMPFQFVLDRAKVNNGGISVHDATGASMVELQGVNADANTSGYTEGRDVTGTLRITDITVPPNLRVTDFSTPFSLNRDQTRVQASPFDASAFGGKIAGDYQTGSSDPSVLNLNAKGLDVAQLTAATVSDSSAKLSGSLDLSSKWRGVETGVLDGEGDAQMANGKLEGVRILQEVGQILKITEIEAPVITRAKTHFVVQNRQTRFIGLQVDSPVFQITGDGTVDFNGNLNANLVLVLTRDAMGRLPKQAAASFVQQQDGTGSIAFKVTGTTNNPKTDLPTRLLMQNTQIKNAIDKALNKFFH
ncbi:MAG TPA: hypothetical protein VGZ93_00850 [Candidatus Methylacidiphilales bacterium]|jgi:uncharacterized protein involved in outer membrane biogenesis|nr:hypothetical protein [Candidatus Methylacidiphilales bacterium]